MPKRSVKLAYLTAQNVDCGDILSVPPALSALNSRSTSSALSHSMAMASFGR